MISEDRIKNIVEGLSAIPVFADLPEEDLTWLVKQGTARELKTEEVLFRDGDVADSLFVLLEGELQARSETDLSDAYVYIMRKGDIGGKLPYSRMTNISLTGRAVMPSLVWLIGADLFPEIGKRIPILIERLVAVMSDRIRYITKEDQQRDRLAALGKLSAGLAHELNNPAAAAKGSTLALSESLEALRRVNARLDQLALSAEQRSAIATFERQASQHLMASPMLDSLTQSEREEELTAWLDKYHVAEGWNLATTLVEANLDLDWLNRMVEKVGKEALGDALSRIVYLVQAQRLTKEIETSTGRISEIVKAIKEYSYMDQAPVQEINLHDGIESTLVILRYKLKHGIEVERNYDRSLPPVYAYGSELNQVWTNVIDNAVDAMKEGGKLRITTAREQDRVLIEIADTGHGIPADIQGRIFEPFFTTKKLGEGTGLGLDLVYRIIRKHHGDVRVESQPGNTRFQVRLPISQPRH